MSAAKAFSKEPPLRPLSDLAAIVEDFQWRYVDTKKTDQVILFCRDAPTYVIAVKRAVEARDENGKHHNHQSKVDITARRKLGASLRSPHIKKRVKAIMDRNVSPFDELHELIDEIKPYGIGPVTVYDVAVRLGAYLGIEPDSVYMHAGVKQGMKALYETIHRWVWDYSDEFRYAASSRAPRIPVKWFPAPLCDMAADDVEDILCTYREVFLTWRE